MLICRANIFQSNKNMKKYIESQLIRIVPIKIHCWRTSPIYPASIRPKRVSLNNIRHAIARKNQHWKLYRQLLNWCYRGDVIVRTKTAVRSIFLFIFFYFCSFFVKKIHELLPFLLFNFWFALFLIFKSSSLVCFSFV